LQEVPAKVPKKLSHRPKSRTVTFRVELGPYTSPTVPGKANKERPAERYEIWVAWLPKGKRDQGGFMSCVQQMNRPGRYADTVHNPIVFKKTRRMFPRADQEWMCKNCLYLARKALVGILEHRLAVMTRPMIRFGSYEGNQYWESFEPGASTNVLGAWREEVLNKLHSYLGA
jgi:hypothetical protein